MVSEVETPDGPAFQCEECGRLFDNEAEASKHEADCFVPPSM